MLWQKTRTIAPAWCQDECQSILRFYTEYVKVQLLNQQAIDGRESI